jgi:hypothetical protein
VPNQNVFSQHPANINGYVDMFFIHRNDGCRDMRNTNMAYVDKSLYLFLCGVPQIGTETPFATCTNISFMLIGAVNQEAKICIIKFEYVYCFLASILSNKSSLKI